MLLRQNLEKSMVTLFRLKVEQYPFKVSKSTTKRLGVALHRCLVYGNYFTLKGHWTSIASSPNFFYEKLEFICHKK